MSINPSGHFQFNILDTHSYPYMTLKTQPSILNASRYSFYTTVSFVCETQNFVFTPKQCSSRPCLS